MDFTGTSRGPAWLPTRGRRRGSWRRRAGHANYRAGPLLVTNGFDGVNAAGIGDAAARVAEGHDFCFLFGEQAGGSGAGVAESLNGDARATQCNLFQLAGLFDDVEQAAGGGFAASFGT